MVDEVLLVNDDRHRKAKVGTERVQKDRATRVNGLKHLNAEVFIAGPDGCLHEGHYGALNDARLAQDHAKRYEEGDHRELCTK